ncbi:MAG: helix-turn-helix transcriptional regulator [Clostridia bacterium]|nr:helix-turn-helix transcriptional regulator [Clostridia bacterium]
MTFKEKIVKLRKLKGLTQDELASAVGVSRQAVYKWESGQSYPEAPKLIELKLIFNISIDDLLDESYDVVLPEKKKRKRLSKNLKNKIESEISEGSFFIKPTVNAAAETSVTVTPEVKEEAPVSENTVNSEPVTVAATVVSEPAPAQNGREAQEPEKPEEQRHVGFFSKLFGRK